MKDCLNWTLSTYHKISTLLTFLKSWARIDWTVVVLALMSCRLHHSPKIMQCISNLKTYGGQLIFIPTFTLMIILLIYFKGYSLKLEKVDLVITDTPAFQIFIQKPLKSLSSKRKTAITYEQKMWNTPWSNLTCILWYTALS